MQGLEGLGPLILVFEVASVSVSAVVVPLEVSTGLSLEDGLVYE